MSQTRSTRDPETPLQEAILTEARRLLETEGYAALSTRRIASAVGCTATSIYLHFKSKDSLIYALIDEGFTELNRRVFEVSRAEADPISALHSVARAYVDFGLERPEYYEIMFMLRAEQMEREVPEFGPGDTVVVQVKVKEGNRERLQAFEGVVIAKRNRGLNSAFTVRKSRSCHRKDSAPTLRTCARQRRCSG